MAKIKELEIQVDLTQTLIWFHLYILYFLLLNVLATPELGGITEFMKPCFSC